MKRRVYMTNRGPHDYSEAEEYGEVVVLTEGVINLLNIERLQREITDKLRDFRDRDILLVNGHAIINTIGVAYLLRMRSVINIMYHVPGSGYNVLWGHDFGTPGYEEQSGMIVCSQCRKMIHPLPSGLFAVSERACDECLAVQAETRGV